MSVIRAVEFIMLMYNHKLFAANNKINFYEVFYGICGHYTVAMEMENNYFAYKFYEVKSFRRVSTEFSSNSFLK